MKKINLAVVLISFLLTSFLFSCENSDTVTISKETYDKLRGVEGSIVNLGEFTTGKHKRDLYIIIIDSCEYVGYLNQSHGDLLTHKGNCKFCAKRK